MNPLVKKSRDINNEFLLESLEEEEVENKILNHPLELKSEMMNQVECDHDWIRDKGDYNIKCIKCAFCIYYPSEDNRATCNICFKQACIRCLQSRNHRWRMEIELESEE